MTETDDFRRDAKILYEYGVDTVLPMLKADGIWIAPAPAPLPAAWVQTELERIAQHENYKRQTISFHSGIDGKSVLLKDGKVSITTQKEIAALQEHHTIPDGETRRRLI